MDITDKKSSIFRWRIQFVDKVYFHAGTALARQRAFKSVGCANASKPGDVYLGLETFGRPCSAFVRTQIVGKTKFFDSYSVGRSLRHAPVL